MLVIYPNKITAWKLILSEIFQIVYADFNSRHDIFQECMRFSYWELSYMSDFKCVKGSGTNDITEKIDFSITHIKISYCVIF